MKVRANRFNSRSITITALAFAAAVFIHGCGRSDTGTSTPQSAIPLQAVQPTLDVREIASPAGVDSREPELFTAPDGRVILSWVEKVGEKRYALRFAARDAAGWSEARTAAEGENWFINWADFP